MSEGWQKAAKYAITSWLVMVQTHEEVATKFYQQVKNNHELRERLARQQRLNEKLLMRIASLELSAMSKGAY